MLDAIRNNSQSWGVKLAFGIIILVFVFWGLGSVQNINNSTTVATVNDVAITVTDFERAYQQMVNDARAQNPQITQEQLKQMQIPQQVMAQLVNRSLLEEEVKRLHLSIPDALLRATIVNIPAFHNAEGVFDPAVYKRVVTQQYLNVGNFESLVREDLVQEKLRREMTFTAQSFASEVAAFFEYTYESRNVDYIFFPAADALASVEAPAEDSVRAYYESNQPRFTLPAKANVEYVAIYPKFLGKPESITSDAINAYYEKNKASKYTTPKQVKARHILLRIDPQASAEELKKVTASMEAIQKELSDGADFAELAKKHSQDPGSAENGGDLGFVGENQTVKPFNDTLFALKDGEVSSIVRTDFGLHILKAEETNPVTVKALTEVENDIRTILAEEAGQLKIREALDSLIEANVRGNDLVAAAKTHGLEVKSSDLKTAAELEKILLITPEQSARIFALTTGIPLDTAMETTDKGFIVARVKAKDEAKVRPFAEVQEEIITTLKNTAALDKALATAAEARKGFDSKAPDDSTVKQVTDIKRGSDMGALGLQAAMGAAFFSAKVG